MPVRRMRPSGVPRRAAQLTSTMIGSMYARRRARTRARARRTRRSSRQPRHAPTRHAAALGGEQVGVTARVRRTRSTTTQRIVTRTPYAMPEPAHHLAAPTADVVDRLHHRVQQGGQVTRAWTVIAKGVTPSSPNGNRRDGRVSDNRMRRAASPTGRGRRSRRRRRAGSSGTGRRFPTRRRRSRPRQWRPSTIPGVAVRDSPGGHAATVRDRCRLGRCRRCPHVHEPFSSCTP